MPGKLLNHGPEGTSGSVFSHRARASSPVVLGNLAVAHPDQQVIEHGSRNAFLADFRHPQARRIPG